MKQNTFWMISLALMLTATMIDQYQNRDSNRNAYKLGFIKGARWAMYPSTTTAQEALRAGMIDAWRELESKDDNREVKQQ